ncbi:hypothetical protein C5167_035889 [Papaver somniferum]|nr:hypothetical protein C5167_035889 [Papaver somniferum]
MPEPTSFKSIVKKKSTENFNGMSYICTLLSTSLWTYYGLLKHDGMLTITINVAGAILQAIYVILFIIYAPKNSKVKHLKLAGILNLGIDFSNVCFSTSIHDFGVVGYSELIVTVVFEVSWICNISALTSPSNHQHHMSIMILPCVI